MSRTRVCIMKYDKDHTAMMLGDFIDHTKPRAEIGHIRPHLRSRITFRIGYTPNSLRRDIPNYWDIHFDGRYIGSLQECFTGITSVFFADEPLRTLEAAKKLSGGNLTRIYSFEEYDWKLPNGRCNYSEAYYPTFSTLEELIEDFLSRRINDPNAERSHRYRGN